MTAEHWSEEYISALRDAQATFTEIATPRAIDAAAKIETFLTTDGAAQEPPANN
jgi:hypothetical protein